MFHKVEELSTKIRRTLPRYFSEAELSAIIFVPDAASSRKINHSMAEFVVREGSTSKTRSF
eukprot:8979830-Pyramimonas_sp.AAC.1